MLIIPLIGDKFLIVAGLVKILDAVAELIAHVSIALAQVEHLHRCDAEAGFGQGGRQQSAKSQQSTAHVEILSMTGVTQIVNDIIGIASHHTAGHDQERHQQQR